MQSNTSLRTALRRRLRFWQSTLKLRDWDITVNVDPDTNVKGRETGGYITVEPYHKRARITIPPTAVLLGIPTNSEMSLVHELLHLHLEGWQVEDFSDKELLKEQAINALAEALVNLSRSR